MDREIVGSGAADTLRPLPGVTMEAAETVETAVEELEEAEPMGAAEAIRGADGLTLAIGASIMECMPTLSSGIANGSASGTGRAASKSDCIIEEDDRPTTLGLGTTSTRLAACLVACNALTLFVLTMLFTVS